MHLNNLSGYKKCVYHIPLSRFPFLLPLNITVLRIAKGEKIVSFPPGGCVCNQGFNDIFPFGACPCLLPGATLSKGSEESQQCDCFPLRWNSSASVFSCKFERRYPIESSQEYT